MCLLGYAVFLGNSSDRIDILIRGMWKLSRAALDTFYLDTWEPTGFFHNEGPSRAAVQKAKRSRMGISVF